MKCNQKYLLMANLRVADLFFFLSRGCDDGDCGGGVNRMYTS